jgi:hypothetical protein
LKRRFTLAANKLDKLARFAFWIATGRGPIAACQARPYMKIRRRLTRQIADADGKNFLDYVNPTFQRIFGRTEEARGAEPSLGPPLYAISKSNWSPESAEVRPLFKAPREDGSWFRAELESS